MAARLNRRRKSIADCPLSAERLAWPGGAWPTTPCPTSWPSQVFEALWTWRGGERGRGDRARQGLKQVSDVGAIENWWKKSRCQPQGVGRIQGRQGKGFKRAGRPGDEGQQGKANPAQVQDILPEAGWLLLPADIAPRRPVPGAAFLHSSLRLRLAGAFLLVPRALARTLRVTG